MKYTNLGGTGVSVSRICLGMMTYGSKQWRDWVLDYAESQTVRRPRARRRHQLLRHGRRLFQRRLGRSVGPGVEGIGVDRTTSSSRPNATAAPTIARVTAGGCRAKTSSNRAMRRLRDSARTSSTCTRFTASTHTPIEETIDALNDLVRAGKVPYLGASSMFAWQMAK